MYKYIMLLLFSVLIASSSQILLKKSAIKTHESVIKEYLNLYTIVAYFIFGVSALITIFVAKYLPLSMISVMESLGYVFIPILSYFFLREKLHKKQILGIALVLFGVILFVI